MDFSSDAHAVYTLRHVQYQYIVTVKPGKGFPNSVSSFELKAGPL